MDSYFYAGGGANRPQEEIDKLKRKTEFFDPKIIPDLIKRAIGETVTEYKLSTSAALTHLVFSITCQSSKKLILRANIGVNSPEVELVIEKLATDLARKHGVIANNILFVDISRKRYPFDFQIHEKVEGLDPEVEFSGNQDDYDKVSFDLGQNVAKLAEIKLPGFGRFVQSEALKGKLVGSQNSLSNYLNINLANELENIAKNHIFTLEIKTTVLKIFDQVKNIGSGCLVHYDIADHNLKYDPKTYHVTGILDWEACVSADPVLDIASIPTWKTLYPREEKVIAGFKSLKKLPDDFEELKNLYRLRTIIWKTDHNLRFDMHTPTKLVRIQAAIDPYLLKLPS